LKNRLLSRQAQHINASSNDDSEYDSPRPKYKKKFRGIELEEAPSADEEESADELGEEFDSGSKGEGGEEALGEEGKEMPADDVVGTGGLNSK